MSLDGQIAVISGGSRGIGAATVRLFIQAGAKVVFNYQKAKDAAAKLVHECGEKNCVAIQADLTGTGNGRKLVDTAVKRFGRCDIVVANHGIWPADDVPVDQMSDKQWHQTIGTNLDAVFDLVRAGVAQMKKQGRGGRIVIVGSTSGQRGEAYHCDYSATKGAVMSLVKSLSSELAHDRILVNCVAPGWVATDMARPALDDPKVCKEIFDTIPIGRVGTPEEIAAPILFLCTEHANFITGEVFNVNGGAVLVG